MPDYLYIRLELIIGSLDCRIYHNSVQEKHCNLHCNMHGNLMCSVLETLH